MYLIQCVTACVALSELMSQEWDYKTAYALLQLKRKLRPHFEFYANEETKLVEEYAAKDERGEVIMPEAGKFALAGVEQAAEYERRRMELNKVEVEEEFPLVKVPCPAYIKPVHIEALEGFVIFYMKGDGAE